MGKQIWKNEKYLYAWLSAGMILVLLVSVFISWNRKTVEIEAQATKALEQIKTICQKYDNYEMGITTKDLQVLINKVNVLQEYEAGLKENMKTGMEEFAREQYLSGIILLDGELNVEYNIQTTEQDNRALLNSILEDRQIRQIRDFPKKVFADRVELEGHIYEYAIAVRQDKNGIVICYSDTTEFQDDKYEISLNNMLDLDFRDKNQILVVTDDKKVLATNAERLIGLTVEECPITNVVKDDMTPENLGLIKLKNNGVTWYGKHDVYRGYYLYIFYRARFFTDKVLIQLSAISGLYLILCLMIMVYIQHRRKEKMHQMEKEYYLTNAIASIYEVNILLCPEKNSWDPILQTAAMERVLSGIEKADEMLHEFSNKLMLPSAGETFLQFTDLESMLARLKDKPFLGCTYEAVTGRWYQVLLVPQNHDRKSKETIVMLLMRNITEQKKKELDYQYKLQETAEKAAIASAAKTDFLRRMSHDIRTPINGIRGMTEMGLACLNDRKKTASCFEKIHTASDFLLELVNNILDMSKIEAGETVTEHIPFDMQEVLERIMMMISSQAKDLGVTVDYALNGTHWQLIGSPLNVQRVFQNIISNAVKYNHSGGSVKVSIEETVYNGKSATFRFVCEDTGCGMSEEFQKHAYDIFVQEQKNARTTYGGSGIGLAIVKKTVDLMGGTISFTSKEGEGTTFVIELTLPVDSTEPEAKEEQEYDIHGVKILVAEDNELNREIASFMLTEKGAQVTEARNGEEAVRLFTTSPAGTFDIILMDIMMPVMNGLEATKAIRGSDHKQAADIPIIAVSANAFSDDRNASRESGMNAHLSKPLDAEKLLECIVRYLNLK